MISAHSSKEPITPEASGVATAHDFMGRPAAGKLRLQSYGSSPQVSRGGL